MLIDSGLVDSTDFRKGAARAKDAQGTPTQSRIPPSILQYTKIVELACAMGQRSETTRMAGEWERVRKREREGKSESERVRE